MVAKVHGMASLSFLVFSRDIPSSVSLREHGIDFRGRDDAAFKGLISGVYGAHSKQAALVHAAAWSRAHASNTGGPNRVLMLDCNYRVSDGDEDTAGWLHMDRMSSEQRSELKSEWMVWIREDTPHGVAERMEDLPLAELALKFPGYIAKMFKRDKHLRGIVHQVNPTINPAEVLWVATVRYEADRFHGASVRYLDKVTVKL